jgi:hypothetical protein
VSTLLFQIADLVTAAAVIIGALVFTVTRRLTTALPVFLDLLLAAGLMRLSAGSSWAALATAATVVVIRKLVVLGLGSSVALRHRDPRGTT